MLELLKVLAQKLIRTVEPIDPTVFGDPVAEQTDWTPAVGGGTNIGTHTLKSVSQYKLVFSATWRASLFTMVFIAIGLGLPLLAAWSYDHGHGMDTEGLAIATLCGLIFAGVGLLTRSKMCSPRSFDKRLGSFWKGRRMPAEVGSQRVSDEHVPLQQIHGDGSAAQ